MVGAGVSGVVAKGTKTPYDEPPALTVRELAEKLLRVMPSESPLDLQRHAEVIAETVLLARLTSARRGNIGLVIEHGELGEHQGAHPRARRRL